MPLKKSASKRAFRYNVKAELEAGKPIKQALAIAFDVKRRAGIGGHRGAPYGNKNAVGKHRKS